VTPRLLFRPEAPAEILDAQGWYDARVPGLGTELRWPWPPGRRPEVVEQLPADATIEDAMERLYLLTKIERGLAQADAGRTLSSEEVRARLGL